MPYATWRQLVNPDDLERLEQNTTAAVLNRAAFDNEWQVKLPPGVAPRWLMARAQPILDDAGRLVSYHGIVIDISKRWQAEEALRLGVTELAQARASAEAANLAKSAFLATMSHELRTPLNAVVGLAALLVDSRLGPRQRDYADKIQLSTQALRVLIDDILDFSKIEAGKLQLEHAPFSLSSILLTTATITGLDLSHKPIEILFDISPGIPDALIGDALHLQQILLNLIGNALKFTETGAIVVSLRSLAQDAACVTVQFTVRDTGIGIPSGQLGHIFDSFTQADTDTSRLYGGSGLGLAICTRLISLMGGEIGVESVLGQGSEFRFSVTLALGDSTPQAPLEEHLLALNILIVDDQSLSREILTQTCLGLGWRATALDCAAAGLIELQRSAAAGCGYDLMLLDWHMPGMDGIEMLRQAYVTTGIALPLVILMAPISELEQAASAANDLHLDGIAAKPLTPASVLNAVTQAYAGDFNVSTPLSKIDRRLAGMRLLVVEDNALNQEVIEQILIRAGASVVLASNGLAAVQALRSPSVHFDAVLMDIQMPVMDGHAATRIIRQELGLVDLPIIALTAFARPEDREKSRLAGMVGHLVKPIDIDDLLDLLDRLDAERQGLTGRPAVRPGQATPAQSEIQLPGLDVASALQSFGGDLTMYRELLRKFMQHHGGDVGEARRLLNAGDTQGAIALVHDLAGIAGLLGAMVLARLAAAVDEAFMDGNAQHMRELPRLFDELQEAMQTIQSAVDQLEALPP
jgi:two-component system sensor histidine kinase/response regulator